MSLNFSFLQEADLTVQVKGQVMNVLTNNSGSEALAEAQAIEEVKSYLRDRYDVEAIFSQTGSSRNQQIVMITIDILLYHLHSQLASSAMPKIREDRYNAAIKWLGEVNVGNISPSIPEKVENPLYPVKTGSRPKYSSRW